MKREGIQLVSPTHGFKFEAPDGKQRIDDVLNSDGEVVLAKHYPNNRASKFLDWFTYSDNTIDGQIRKKAYTLFESGLLNSLEPGSKYNETAMIRALYMPPLPAGRFGMSLHFCN